MTIQSLARLDNDFALWLEFAEDGTVALLHDKSFPADVCWVEVDQVTGMLDFILEGGIVANAGLPLPDSHRRLLQLANEVAIVQVDSEKWTAKSALSVPLINVLDVNR